MIVEYNKNGTVYLIKRDELMVVIDKYVSETETHPVASSVLYKLVDDTWDFMCDDLFELENKEVLDALGLKNSY